MTVVVIVWMFVILFGYFNTKHSKETEKKVEEYIKQNKTEQIDSQSLESFDIDNFQ
tara:strand:+ start:513 stop:680 length:168 start_codon:yes stop_codon:yes gene_type:complete